MSKYSVTILGHETTRIDHGNYFRLKLTNLDNPKDIINMITLEISPKREAIYKDLKKICIKEKIKIGDTINPKIYTLIGEIQTL